MRRPGPGDHGKETGFEVRNHDAPLTLAEYQRLPRHPIHLVLDHLRSAFNVGSIFRTADTTRLARIVTCGYTAHPPHPSHAVSIPFTARGVRSDRVASVPLLTSIWRARTLPATQLDLMT